MPMYPVSHESDAGHLAELSKGFRSYATYKNSEVSWLGAIPSHWKVMRLKSFANVQLSNVDKKSVADQVPIRLCNYVDVYYNEHVSTEFDFMKATATPDQVHRFSLKEGDVLITKDSEQWTDIAVPSVVTQNLPGVLCGYHLAHIRPNGESHGPFLSRVFAAIGPRDQFRVAANGITRFGLTRDAIRDGVLPLPSRSEQQSIASFLDRETAKIDALVAKKERLTELLEEKRSALIARAVTRGLDGAAPLKDSGVDWLGKIPMHWDIKPVWAAFRLGRGRVISHEDIRQMPGTYPVYSSQTENDGVLGHIATYDFDGPHLTWTTDGAKAGAVFSRQGRFSCTNVCGTMRQIKATTENIEYMRYALNLATYWFVRHDINPKLMNNVMAGIRVPLPPIDEQNLIATFLKKEIAKIDILLARIEDAIVRLNELRGALISAAVTGTIDVRNSRE